MLSDEAEGDAASPPPQKKKGGGYDLLTSARPRHRHDADPPFDEAPSIGELRELMDSKDVAALQRRGGLDDLLERLRSHPKRGLAESDQALYGRRALYLLLTLLKW